MAAHFAEWPMAVLALMRRPSPSPQHTGIKLINLCVYNEGIDGVRNDAVAV